MTKIIVENLFDEQTNTFTYLVKDLLTKEAVVIDPVLNYQAETGQISFESYKQLLRMIEGFTPTYFIETHAHADHLTSLAYLKQKYPNAKTAIHENIIKVQNTFKDIFKLAALSTDGSQFDLLLNEKSQLKLGNALIEIISTPGHTPACACLKIEEHLFSGDALFMPDFGTGRCDFPQGSATNLYHSIYHKLYKLPQKTKVYVGHDYAPNGRKIQNITSIAESKKNNIHLNGNTTMNEFVDFRTKRDTQLSPPKLLIPSIQFNINGGHFLTDKQELAYIKIPITVKRDEDV